MNTLKLTLCRLAYRLVMHLNGQNIAWRCWKDFEYFQETRGIIRALWDGDAREIEFDKLDLLIREQIRKDFGHV